MESDQQFDLLDQTADISIWRVWRDGNQDVLATTLVENFGNKKRRRRMKRPINIDCKVLEEEYMVARREYNTNRSEENEIRLKEAGVRKRKAIRRLSRKLFPEKRVELEGLAPTEFAAELKRLRLWKPRMEIRASVNDFVEASKRRWAAQMEGGRA